MNIYNASHICMNFEHGFTIHTLCTEAVSPAELQKLRTRSQVADAHYTIIYALHPIVLLTSRLDVQVDIKRFI
jgi:hypothetical protein